MADVPTHDELVQRARDLQPTLRERWKQTDELRRLPDETIEDLKEAGFFRMLQPEQWGGYECDPRTYYQVQWTLAEACPSTAWVFGVVGVHSWQLALFPKEAQQEVWGEDTSALISSSYAPTGKIERADGGYRVSGRWSFSSGCDHCQWVFLGGFAPTEPDAKAPDMRTFLLPRSDYTIEDNWHVAGLKGTGSKDIVVDGAFVPEHRTHRIIDGYKRNSPGNEVNPAPLFRLPFGQVFVRSVSTSAIGAATGALKVFAGVAAKRIAASDGAKVAVDPKTQELCTAAAAVIEESKLTLLRSFDEMMTAVKAGQDIPVDRRIQFRYESSATASKCVGVVNDLFRNAGGRAIFLDAEILHYFLDCMAAGAHYANNPSKPARNWGGVQLGLKNVDYFI
jgi:3-hydroxy-9,10-secoandrosta-1,3,5(10)-triene-9,17-dione monooxygenase